MCTEALSKALLNLQASIDQTQAMISWNGLPIIRAHEIRLVQLLQNLIGNAIKYRGAEPRSARGRPAPSRSLALLREG